MQGPVSNYILGGVAQSVLTASNHKLCPFPFLMQSWTGRGEAVGDITPLVAAFMVKFSQRSASSV